MSGMSPLERHIREPSTRQVRAFEFLTAEVSPVIDAHALTLASADSLSQPVVLRATPSAGGTEILASASTERQRHDGPPATGTGKPARGAHAAPREGTRVRLEKNDCHFATRVRPRVPWPTPTTDDYDHRCGSRSGLPQPQMSDAAPRSRALRIQTGARTKCRSTTYIGDR